MSTSAPVDDGAAFAYFVSPQIPGIALALAQMQTTAIRARLPEIRGQISSVLDELLRRINDAAVRFTAISEVEIIKALEASHHANRPRTGDMETHIISAPGPLGTVKVALISDLDKIVNPGGYGTFWRAQEYGTGNDEVPSQVGRYFRGIFTPSGDAPRLRQRGLGVGRDQAFHSDPTGGLGVINVELPGRHFLERGAIEAGERYKVAMDAIDRWASEQLDSLLVEVVAARRASRLTIGIIEA